MKGSSCVLGEQQPQRSTASRLCGYRPPDSYSLRGCGATPISAAPHLDSPVSAISLRVQTSDFTGPAPFPWMYMLFCHR
ncbi:hypothetical protein SAMN05428953_10649 [Mesorhizobium muleiense]|uniref:Uncharacterized protein n=1 Tax=Mesorhizobium muleiense TaxID=1004279 RepID=A0A1G8TDR5_9HYPH|nr:hypothetical protein SAMN05428953_10649 [Mesorhizobium muleiense]